jgi:Protein of unknown function (DUF2630)
MTDETIADRIEQLVAEEHELRRREEQQRDDVDALAADQARLAAVSVELDRCWDLLRRRRAARSVGADPEQVTARDAHTVERYRQ